MYGVCDGCVVVVANVEYHVCFVFCYGGYVRSCVVVGCMVLHVHVCLCVHVWLCVCMYT